MPYKFYTDDFADAMLEAERLVKAGGFADLTAQDVLVQAARKPGAREAFAGFSADAALLSETFAHPVAGLHERRRGAYAGPSDDFKDALILTLKEVAARTGESKAGVLDYVAALARRRPKWFVDAMAMVGVETGELFARVTGGRGGDVAVPDDALRHLGWAVAPAAAWTAPALGEALGDLGWAPVPAAKAADDGAPAATRALDVFCQDLTRAAAEGRLGSVVGRDDEIARLVSVLNRKTKNNPCLVGDPGVGKTAVVEGLAARIARGQVPKAMAGKRVLSLDVAALVAGTRYTGEFESRMKAVIAEAGRPENGVVLFVDEIHTLIGAGDREGRLDAANMLKPAMARGGIRIIGATTADEYQRYVEKDPALERRLQKVEVGEPKRDDAVAILRGIRQGLEDHHGLAIADDALEAAVDLSIRYLPSRFLPDKAIDLLDEACAAMSAGGDGGEDGQAGLAARAAAARGDMFAAIEAGDFEKAKEAKERAACLRAELDCARSRGRLPRDRRQTVAAGHIRETVRLSTGIPVGQSGARERIVAMEAALKAGIVGQGDAVAAVAAALTRSCAGVAGADRPVGSFLFLGPSGVGKTETAKLLARAFYGDRKALVRFDMSEFSEGHSVSRLIGPPPGYVGNENGGQLTGALRRNPYCVVLFDEVEKAHRDVLNVLLQALEDGELTDGRGRKADFRNAVVVMTSNVGAAALDAGARRIGFSTGEAEAAAGFEAARDSALAALRKAFAPEFLNRVDGTVVFKPLTLADLAAVAELRLAELAQRLAKAGSALSWDRGAAEAVAKASFDPSMGARPVRRYVQDHVETPLASMVLDGGPGSFRAVPGGDGVKVAREGGGTPSGICCERAEAGGRFRHGLATAGLGR